MPWYNALVGEPFLNWLRQAADGKYTPLVKGDPFSTSMRDFDDVTPNLQAISQGTVVQRQRMTDLRGAKLVADDGDSLSDLGTATLSAWTQFGVADSQYEHELPRHLILICEALIKQETFYVGLNDFWLEQIESFGVDETVERWDDLIFLNYFSKTLNGFNPMAHVDRADLVVPWNSVDIKNKISSMVDASDRALVGLDRIIDTLESAISRGKAKKIFIIAICLISEPSVSFATQKLSQWTLPLTSTSSSTSYAQLPAVTLNLCLSILASYEQRLRVLNNNLAKPVNLELLVKRKNVILFGPPGTGKTHGANQIADYWKGKYGASSVIATTFHPTYSYEDFVWGWRPNVENGEGFIGQNGALLEACSLATDGTPTLLFIDEINRADTARVFGELITYIEADKRERPFRIAQDSKNDRVIPSNLYILGTMNTADRSVSLLDVALRRRFAFVEYIPDPSIFSQNSKWLETINGISIKGLMTSINTRLIEVGVESDRAIGHALFSVSSSASSPLNELRDRIQYDIYPLVVDYCFSDRSRVSQVLGTLVSSEGKFNHMDDSAFISALNGITG